jgi:hypothetical protein
MDVKMNDRFGTLFAHERSALLAALRRDLRKETEKSMHNDDHHHFHAMNARLTLRLLEVLNPKSMSDPSAAEPGYDGLACKDAREAEREKHGDLIIRETLAVDAAW